MIEIDDLIRLKHKALKAHLCLMVMDEDKPNLYENHIQMAVKVLTDIADLERIRDLRNGNSRKLTEKPQ